MPNLLLVITGACIIAYVVRETLEDLQKKKADHDEQDHGQHHPAVHNRSGVRRL